MSSQNEMALGALFFALLFSVSPSDIVTRVWKLRGVESKSINSQSSEFQGHFISFLLFIRNSFHQNQVK